MPAVENHPQTLIAEARDGDPAAWSWLHRQYGPRVKRWCRTLGGGRIDAEDAAQEVFIRLSRVFYRFDPAGSFEPYLYSITRRVVSEQRRRAWVRRWAGEIGFSVASSQPTPEVQATLSEAAQVVEEILAELSAAHREVLLLCVIEQRTSAEAATLLGIKPPTVRKRLGVARAKFNAAARRRGLEG